jgi:hypothetical protein
MARTAREPLRAGAIAHRFDSARQSGGVFGRDEDARLAVLDDLRNAPDRARYHGHPGRERLEKGLRDALGSSRGQDETVHGAQKVRHVGPEPREDDRVSKTAVLRESLDPGAADTVPYQQEAPRGTDTNSRERSRRCTCPFEP